MPRRDDSYYRARPDLFLNSRTRYLLTRAQWADYRDLLDLIYQHQGQVINDLEWLADELRTTVDDLKTVVSVEHFYTTDDGKHIRHIRCDEEIEDRDNARKRMAELSERGVAARQKRTGNRSGNRRGNRNGSEATEAAKEPTRLPPVQSVSHSRLTDVSPAAAPAPSGGRRGAEAANGIVHTGPELPGARKREPEPTPKWLVDMAKKYPPPPTDDGGAA